MHGKPRRVSNSVILDNKMFAEKIKVKNLRIRERLAERYMYGKPRRVFNSVILDNEMFVEKIKGQEFEN